MHADQGRGRGRKRDAEATRAALLEAAQDLFGRYSYEQVTLREIGQQAGVDGSLIARYFGSKAALHKAAVDKDSWQVGSELATDFVSFAMEALRRVDQRQTPGPLVQALLLSTSDDAARGTAAEEVRSRLVEPLTEQLAAEGVSDPAMRAETLMACLVGVIALRSSGMFAALSAASPEQLSSLLALLSAEEPTAT
ncbi:TetR family transcriptional regulator [Streptomyces sp. NPDC046805]|uniref:TetR/AcrR family transcriptional regulator n=1 Tax=Streptomyces sp. NPDC046805 TaxID=3155134 RepID=UPI003401F2F6